MCYCDTSDGLSESMLNLCGRPSNPYGFQGCIILLINHNKSDVSIFFTPVDLVQHDQGADINHLKNHYCPGTILGHGILIKNNQNVGLRWGPVYSK